MIIAISATCALLAAKGAIGINTGRQLFVDDFLIASTNGIVRHWNRPVKSGRPVLSPAADDPANLTGAADGGLWWDPTCGKYRLWYQKDWFGAIHYAESTDGLRWTARGSGRISASRPVFSEKIPHPE